MPTATTQRRDTGAARRAPVLGGLSAVWVHRWSAVVVAVFAVALLATQGTLRDVVSTIPNFVPTLVLAVLLLRRRLPDHRAWAYVLGGVVVLDVYAVNWLVQAHVFGAVPPSDLLTILGLPLGYVVVLIGAAKLLESAAGRDTGALLDAAVIAIGVALLVWVVVLSPNLAVDSVYARGRTLATVVLISGIAGALVRAMVNLPARRTSLAYLLATITATLAGTLARDLTATSAQPAGAGWVPVLWAVAYVALAAAALHPSARAIVTAHPEPARLTRHRALMLGVALSIGPALIGVTELLGTRHDTLLVVATNLVMVPLVVTRIFQLAGRHADAEERLSRMATRDELTDLPNRRVLDARVRDLLGRAGEPGSHGGIVAFLDLDDFKEVNDVQGHHVGDQLLVVVAERLRSVVRPHDLVARFAGDEFVVVMEGDPASLLRDVLPRIATVLDEPVTLGAVTMPCGASVGAVEIWPGDTRSSEQVLSAADARMYERKRLRKTSR